MSLSNKTDNTDKSNETMDEKNESNELYENGLFIFRRDLRMVDNTGLNLLNTKCKNIYTIFIFTPEQVTDNTTYKSENEVQFMIECLEDLSDDIKKNGGTLYSFYGENNNIIEHLIKSLDINIIGFNFDYSPYAIKHDELIIDLCDKMKVEVLTTHDYDYEYSIKERIVSPSSFRKINFHKKNEIDSYSSFMSLKLALHKFTPNNPHLMVYGGREESIKILNKAVKTYSHNHTDLNNIISELSAYIKFGCISIREIYKNIYQ
jgi:deoxyribodipyrimidine photo-lyase